MRHYLKILILLVTSIRLSSQEIPPIASYTTEDYQAENQNWSISQGENKFIYAANNKGLLEFNGANWQLYASPNETIMRSVNVVGDKIYTGCYMEFGFWQRNNLGRLNYTSLSESIYSELATDEQFWNIIALDDWILFQSFNRIYIYNAVTKDFKIISSETMLTKMVETNGKIYFQKLNKGIFQIENGEAQLVIDDKRLKQNYLINVFDIKGELVFQTQKAGFFKWSNRELSKWEISANGFLKNYSVYNSIQLKNGGFALGTISNGIIFLDREGNLTNRINQSKGLSNNTVLSLFEDIENNIWLGLDNGIDCINVESPFSIYKDNRGELGTIYAAAIFKEKLFLGTNQGLFYRELKSTEDFKPIAETRGQVWNLKSYDDKLFVCHNLGTIILDDKSRIENFFNGQGTWDIKQIESNPDLLLQGKYNGLDILEKKNGKWALRNKIEGFDVSSKYLTLLGDGRIFVNHEYKGVYKLTLDESLQSVLKVEIDNSLEKGLNSSLIKYDDEIYYAFKQGIFKYYNSLNAFKKDSILSQFYNSKNYLSGKLVEDSMENQLWGFTKDEIVSISKGQLSDKPEINRIAISNDVREMMIGYENILNIGEGTYLIGTSSGYILMETDRIIDKDYQLSINSIENSAIGLEVVKLDKSMTHDLKNDWANIKFSFSVPEYNKFLETSFQYRLEGLYKDWSKWSQQSNAVFENLPFGDYTFKVRAKVGNRISDSVATFQFSVSKPWYATNSAIAVYLLILILFSIFMHITYKSYYKRQKNKLVEANKRDLELKELENEQEVMQIKNEKLEQDIANKNRELAISTMSLIKKN
ncbi:MAG: triple tyrosine motif-containing protein [Bacteroidota bacterium]